MRATFIVLPDYQYKRLQRHFRATSFFILNTVGVRCPRSLNTEGSRGMRSLNTEGSRGMRSSNTDGERGMHSLNTAGSRGMYRPNCKDGYSRIAILEWPL